LLRSLDTQLLERIFGADKLPEKDREQGSQDEAHNNGVFKAWGVDRLAGYEARITTSNSRS
jgi:hypothetical protein